MDDVRHQLPALAVATALVLAGPGCLGERQSSSPDPVATAEPTVAVESGAPPAPADPGATSTTPTPTPTAPTPSPTKVRATTRRTGLDDPAVRASVVPCEEAAAQAELAWAGARTMARAQLVAAARRSEERVADDLYRTRSSYRAAALLHDYQLATALEALAARPAAEVLAAVDQEPMLGARTDLAFAIALTRRAATCDERAQQAPAAPPPASPTD